MASMSYAEIRRLADDNAQSRPRPGTDWREAATGKVVRVVNKPLDPDTFAPLVCYYESGEPIYVSTVERFLEDVDMPNGSRRPRHEPVEI